MVGMKFYLSPTEKNLLISYWYDIRHYRRVKPGTSIDEYLDSRVRAIKRNMTDMDETARLRQMNGDLFVALKNKRIRSMFVCYLESPSPKEGYREVAAAIRSAWRMDEEEDGMVESPMAEERDSRVEDGPVVGEGGSVVGEGELVVGEGELVVGERGRRLNARTYVIAVQLYFELEGKDLEFEALSRRLPELTNFIRERFGAEKLPGRLEDFKGYSYKNGLKERSIAKRGQLRTPFRQIMEHPEIFGDAVAARAGEILHKHFK